MQKLELKRVSEHSNRAYYLVNNYLPVMHHFGWTLVKGQYSYRRPPFILTDAPSFDTVEELVDFWRTRIAPQKVREAMELIKFNEGLEPLK